MWAVYEAKTMEEKDADLEKLLAQIEEWEYDMLEKKESKKKAEKYGKSDKSSKYGDEEKEEGTYGNGEQQKTTDYVDGGDYQKD